MKFTLIFAAATLLNAAIVTSAFAQTSPASIEVPAGAEVNSKYYRVEPGSNGEYFDTRSMRWFTGNGQPCS